MPTLDVGCGGKPRGSVNVELYFHSSEHRFYDVEKKHIPNLVVASVNYLPFRDQVFSEVTCFDVLEHHGVDLERAINELVRVCQRFIEFHVPSNLVFQAIPFRHKGHKLVFTPRMIHQLLKNFQHEIYVNHFGRLFRVFPFFVPLAYNVRVWAN